MSWLPQILWLDELPKQVMDHVDAPVRAAALALAAARVGTDHPWPLIALELGLPTGATTSIGALWTRTCRDGTWPTALTALDRLIDRLQRHPPPINYQIRRIIGDDTALLTDAVDHASGDARTPTDDPFLLVRRLWELFTGGDIAYAPPALAIPVEDPRYPVYRAAAVPLTAASPPFPAAFAQVRGAVTLPVTGPLTWTPSQWPPPIPTSRAETRGIHLASAETDAHLVSYGLLNARPIAASTSSEQGIVAAMLATNARGAERVADQHATAIGRLYRHLLDGHPPPPSLPEAHLIETRAHRCLPVAVDPLGSA